MYKNNKVIRRYSEPFKLKILSELSAGKHTKSELCKLYSIAPTTVNEWIKKYNRKDLIKAKGKSKGFASSTTITHCFGLKRDAYHKYKLRTDNRLKIEQQIIEIVGKRRRSLPREGVRKLVKSLDDEFTKANLKIGRDTLFNILRKHQMPALRKKYSTRTTNSYHRFYKYKNIIKGIEVIRSDQVWVSDITYIRTVKGFCYLALITDVRSRKMVGYDIK